MSALDNLEALPCTSVVEHEEVRTYVLVLGTNQAVSENWLHSSSSWSLPETTTRKPWHIPTLHGERFSPPRGLLVDRILVAR